MVAPPVGAQRGVMVAPLGLVILAALGVIGSHGEEVASCPQALDDNLAFCNAPQINLLINAGSVGTDPNCFISTQKGYAIHSAVEWYNALLFNDCYPTLTRILQWGADPNLKKGSGALNIMPLHMMIEGCLKPTPQMPKLESGLALLIEFKADPKVEDYKRRTAIELAQSLGASAKAIAILKGLPPPTPAPAAFGEPSPSAGADTGGGNSNIATFLVLGALPLTICACAFAYKFCKKGSGAESDSESDVTDLSDDSYIPMQQVEKPQGPMIIMAPTTSDEEDNPDMSLKPAIPKKAGTKHAAEISKLKAVKEIEEAQGPAARRVYFEDGHGKFGLSAKTAKIRSSAQSGQLTNKADKDPFLRHTVDGGVKFESLTHPGFYVRVEATEIVLGKPDGKREVFSEVPARNGAGKPYMTLESHAAPKSFVNHCNGMVFCHSMKNRIQTNDAVFNNDATWRLRDL